MPVKLSFKKRFRHSNKLNISKPEHSSSIANKLMSTHVFNKPARLYEKKAQQLKTLKKIKKSSYINEMRMKIAKTKYQYVLCHPQHRLCEQIFNEVLKRLAQMPISNKNEYSLILISLIVEGCIQMFEQDIKIKVLDRDLTTVKNLLEDVNHSFQYFMQQEMGQQFPINFIVLENDTLKERLSFEKELNKNEENQMAIGGVILTDETGNIVFKNTFDSRLNILKETALPLIRQALWGKETQQNL